MRLPPAAATTSTNNDSSNYNKNNEVVLTLSWLCFEFTFLEQFRQLQGSPKIYTYATLSVSTSWGNVYVKNWFVFTFIYWLPIWACNQKVIDYNNNDNNNNAISNYLLEFSLYILQKFHLLPFQFFFLLLLIT